MSKKISGVFQKYDNILGVIYEDGSMNPSAIPMNGVDKATITNLGSKSKIIFQGHKSATVHHDSGRVTWNMF